MLFSQLSALPVFAWSRTIGMPEPPVSVYQRWTPGRSSFPRNATGDDCERLVAPDGSAILDAPLQVVGLFDGPQLRADEPEHDRLALGNEAQRLEGPVPLLVILQEKAMMVELVEEPLGDCVVVALARLRE